MCQWVFKTTTHFLDDVLFQDVAHIDDLPLLRNTQVVLGILASCVTYLPSYLIQTIPPSFSFSSLLVGFNMRVMQICGDIMGPCSWESFQQASKVHVLSILADFFPRMGFMSLWMDFQLFMVWFSLSLLWILAFVLACTHVPYIRVLCPWDWIFTSHGLVFFFLSMWIWIFGFTCTLVPYMRVLCPWEWILASQNLVFFLSMCIWIYGPTCIFSVFYMMLMHRNLINSFCVACTLFVGRSFRLCVLLEWYTKRCWMKCGKAWGALFVLVDLTILVLHAL